MTGLAIAIIVFGACVYCGLSLIAGELRKLGTITVNWNPNVNVIHRRADEWDAARNTEST